ncbi:hypothetical protein MSG28_015709 [Choristoneura fumiferana]|uniref:Uncharacterized protein n=1 Tax=Choristoneura fumiferana TaxID=7141 RepID=A0ACC0KB33_CHOFU|nr:hypothetical protein MSG28_015709 [Choristoneura fumiferana]
MANATANVSALNNMAADWQHWSRVIVDWAEFNAAASTIDALRPSVRSPAVSPRHSPRAARRAPAPHENAYGELRAPPLPPRKSLSPAEPTIACACSVQDIATASAQVSTPSEPRRRSSLEPEPDSRHRLTSIITGSTETITGIIDTRHEVPPDPRAFEKPRRACTPQSNSRPSPRLPPPIPMRDPTENGKTNPWTEQNEIPREKDQTETGPTKEKAGYQNRENRGPERPAERDNRPQERLAEREHRVPERPVEREHRAPERPVEREHRVPDRPVEREHRAPERPVEKLPERPIEREHRVPERPVEREHRVPERPLERENRVPEREHRVPERENRIPERPLERDNRVPERLTERENRVPDIHIERDRVDRPVERNNHVPIPERDRHNHIHADNRDKINDRVPLDNRHSEFRHPPERLPEKPEHRVPDRFDRVENRAPPRQRSLPSTTSGGDHKPTKSTTMPKFPSEDIKDPPYENVASEKNELAVAPKKFNPLTHDKHGRKYADNVSYENINLDYIARLVGEGYPKDIVVRALGITRNDLEMACDILHEFGSKVSNKC